MTLLKNESDLNKFVDDFNGDVRYNKPKKYPCLVHGVFSGDDGLLRMHFFYYEDIQPLVDYQKEKGD